MIGRLFGKRSGELPRDQSDAFVENIRILISEDQTQLAIKLTKRHQRKYPHDKPGLCNSSIAISIAGHPDVAAEILAKATLANPDEPRLIGNLSAAYYRNDQIYLALEHARESVRLGPEVPQAIKLLADILADLGEVDEAKEICLNYLAGYAPHYMVLFKVGVCDLMLNDFSGAVTHFERALELNPKHTASHGNLGAAYIGLDQYEQAEPHVLKSLELFPNYGVSLCNLAQIYEAQDRDEDAYQMYLRATEVDPEYERAYEDVERMRGVLGLTDEHSG